MPGNFTYGLYPWQWVASGIPGISMFAPPPGSVAVLDLRPVSVQSQAASTAGYGFFAWPDGVTPPGDLISLGYGYAGTLQPSGAARSEMKTRLGLSRNPQGATLADCMADVLGALADPTGVSGPHPLMPLSDGSLEIVLESHSRVWSGRVPLDAIMANRPTGHANAIAGRIKLDLTIAESAGGQPLLNKVLGAKLMELGMTRAEVKAGSPGRKAEWQRLVPAALQAKHGSKVKPEEPATTYSESWPTTGVSISTSQDKSWTTSGGFSVSAGHKAYPSSGASNDYGRCEHDLSSANMRTSAPLTSLGDYAVGLLARFSAAAVTCYYGRILRAGANIFQICKVVTGVETSLGTAAFTGTFTDASCYQQANGSTIAFSVPGYSVLSVTDTAITGNLRGGVYGNKGGSVTDNLIGAVTIADFVNPPVADFTGTPTSGTASLSVAFTDASTNTPTSWLWEKSSDGGSTWSNFAGSPTSQNPTESFAAGTWAIRLTATNAGGSDGETKLAYLTVTAAGGQGLRLGLGLGVS